MSDVIEAAENKLVSFVPNTFLKISTKNILLCSVISVFLFFLQLSNTFNQLKNNNTHQIEIDFGIFRILIYN
jgi:hypothetical protein